MRQRILIVDHREDCREILASQLRRTGYNVIEADSSARGVEKAISEVPNLIIMDLELPGLNVTRATHWLKDDPRTKFIPIVHTTRHDEGHKQDPLRTGVDCVLTKPIPCKVLREVVQRFLQPNA
jgi:two-component system, cell cycle response regulator DivK